MIATFFRMDNMVINISIDESEPGLRKAVAVAIWKLPGEKKQDIHENSDCDGRRDASPKRMEAFSQAIKDASEKYFESVYSDKQIQLWILGTHPDYQRHGIGAMQCAWGIHRAEAQCIPVTVLSSPMGGNLYQSLGFQVITYVTVQVEGEEEKHSMGVMVYNV